MILLEWILICQGVTGLALFAMWRCERWRCEMLAERVASQQSEIDWMRGGCVNQFDTPRICSTNAAFFAQVAMSREMMRTHTQNHYGV
jgi:hypothetical protein